MTQQLTVRHFIRSVYTSERDVAPSTLTHHEYTLRSLERFLGREATLGDFDEAILNHWLARLREKGLAAATINGRRLDALAWWNCAADCEPPLVERPPRARKVRRVKTGRRVPIAWTPDEIKTLIETADRMRGFILPLECARRLYWGSLFRAAWDSALRRCDLCRVRYADILRKPDGSGLIVVTQSKTGDDVVVQFRPETMAAVDRMMQMSRPRDECWPLWGGVECFYTGIRSIIKAAGVRPGTYKWFRRASVTARERIAPGLGQLAAGHASPDMARLHYIDRSQLAPAPLPPSVEAAPPLKQPTPIVEPADSVAPQIFRDGKHTFTTTLNLGTDA